MHHEVQSLSEKETVEVLPQIWRCFVMKAVQRTIDKVDQLNARIARVCCLFVERFRQDRRSEFLDGAQDFIRMVHRATRAEINLQKERDRRRSRHFSSRALRSQVVARRINRHIELLKLRLTLLRRRRRIVRSAADALAWLALSGHPGMIPRLFREQTHDLPDERGLIGHVMIQEAAHGSGEYLVIENDLTRCLGVGDLTIVPLADRALPPICVEVKTSAPRIGVGEEARLELNLLEVEHPRARAVLEHFLSLLGPDFLKAEEFNKEGRQQLETFSEQGIAAVQHQLQVRNRIGTVEGNWKAVAHVLNRAQAGRPSLNIAERGVWFGAVKATNDQALFERDIRKVRELALQRIPGARERGFLHVSSLDLENLEASGALTQPIAVWMIPVTLRAGLLNGDVVLLGWVLLDSLEGALRSAGVQPNLSRDRWVLERDGRQVILPQFEAVRARLDMAFGGMKMASVSERLVEAVSRLEEEGAD